MGFWIFMFTQNLLIPILMIVAGKWMHSTKVSINGIMGYRTRMSSKNEDTWYFAQRYCGKLWMKLGLVMLVPSIIVNFFVINRNDDIVGGVGSIIISIQCIIMFATIGIVEKALKQEFDKDGHRRAGKPKLEE